MDPYRQYAAAEAAYGKGLIDKAQWYALDADEKACQDYLAKGQYDATICFNLLSYVVDQSYGGSIKYRVSTYDARRSEPKHGSRTFPPGHKVVETYLGGWDLSSDDPGTLSTSIAEEVLTAIHATAAKDAEQVYMECTDPPYNALSHQDGKGVVPDIVAVLQHKSKPRLLFFNGMEDLICNHVGNEKMLENLPWSGKDDWILASRYAWKATHEPEGKVSGYMKEYENLGFLKILNAGHMVRQSSQHELHILKVGLTICFAILTVVQFDRSQWMSRRSPSR
jgi:carboxypeptidase D